MRRTLKMTAQLVRRCWKTAFLFEFLFYLFSSYVVFPACRLVFNSCLEWTGLFYLTQENILRFCTHPVMILCTLLIAFLFSLTAMIEISCLITCLHTSKTRMPMDIFQMIYEGTGDAIRMLRPQNLSLMILTAFLVPFLQVFTTTSPLRRINLPWEALAEYAFSFPYVLGTAAYGIGVLLVLTFASGLYHRYILENVSVREAFSRSVRANRGVRLKRLGTLIGCALGISAVLLGGFTLVSKGLNLFIRQILADLNLTYRVWHPLSFWLNFLKNAAPKIFFFACLSVLYYRTKKDEGQPLPGQAVPIRARAKRFNSIVFYTVLVLTAGCLILYDTVLRPILVRYDALEYVDDQTTLIVAHRGSADGGDENTINAFNRAFDLGADYIELDVQQTADGVVIVNHDNTLRRVYGDDRRVWETPYTEIADLRTRHSNEELPSLYRVLEFCNPKANLMIELKNNGHNPDLPQAVYDILVDCGCLDRCVIQSSSYRMIREFKKLAPDVRCGYILSFALGHYASLEAADFFSLDSSFVNQEVVNALQRRGKKLFVWTVNDEKRMKELQDMGVNGIITDDVPLAKATLFAMDDIPLEDWMAEAEDDALKKE